MKKTGTGNQKQESIFEDYMPIYVDMTDIQVEQCLRQRVQTALNNLYGSEPDSKIQIRLKEEWSAIKRSGLISDIAFWDEFCSWMKAKRYPYQVLPGGSLILFLLGITQGNPLQPHYHCKDCHRTEWITAPDGYDLSIPDLSLLLDDVQDHRACPCGSMDVLGDGHDVPWEMVFGMSEIYRPCLHINLPESMQDEFPLFIERHWVATDCNAVLLHRIDHKSPVFHFLHMTCSFVFQESILPMNYYDIELSADLTGVALTDWKALMGDMIIPEDIPKPRTFAELIANYCLVKSECLWNETSKMMVEQLDFSTATLLFCQENIFDYYCNHGYSQAEAWSKMYRISGGHAGEYPDHTVEMAYSKDCWMLGQMSRISGCVPRKADTIETILTALRKHISAS